MAPPAKDQTGCRFKLLATTPTSAGLTLGLEPQPNSNDSPKHPAQKKSPWNFLAMIGRHIAVTAYPFLKIWWQRPGRPI